MELYALNVLLTAYYAFQVLAEHVLLVLFWD